MLFQHVDYLLQFGTSLRANARNGIRSEVG